MKLATYKDGSRDGQLVVVSRDLSRAHYATGAATDLAADHLAACRADATANRRLGTIALVCADRAPRRTRRAVA